MTLAETTMGRAHAVWNAPCLLLPDSFPLLIFLFLFSVLFARGMGLLSLSPPQCLHGPDMAAVRPLPFELELPLTLAFSTSAAEWSAGKLGALP